MKLQFKSQTLQQVLQQRTFAYGVCVVLLLSNLLLVVKLFTSDEHWILIPQFDRERRVGVSKENFSQEYLVSWADSILSDLMTVNPASIEAKTRRFLAVSSEYYGSLKDKMATQAKRIKDEQISTVFYPKSFEVDHGHHTVTVQGDFLTFFGQDKKPVSATKTFILSFRKGDNGVILVSGLEEIKKND
jgi:conjugal transfer pilus assembly protein TraE